MSQSTKSDVPAERITEYITTTLDGVDVVSAMGATFISLDPVRHFPSIATIVTTDEHDPAAESDLARPGVYRLNIGLGKATFRRLFPARAKAEVGAKPDYTALDRLMPHPVYARQNWVCILNPSEDSFETLVKPLLAEAVELERARAQRRQAGSVSRGRSEGAAR
jgi:hypothetical protein